MLPQIRGAALAAGAIVVLAVSGSAQTHHMHIGPQGFYNFDNERWGIGAQFSLPVAHHLEIYPSFNYYFVDEGSLWGLNADLKYRAFGKRLDWLYVGGGLNVTRSSVLGFNDDHAGLNLLAGAETIQGGVHPFAEARLTLGDGSRFQLGAGLNITLGRR